MRLDRLDVLVCSDALGLTEPFRDAVVVVNEPVFDDEAVDVEVDPVLVGPLLEWIESELHPLSRREGQQILRNVVPETTDLLACDEHVIERLVFFERVGHLVEGSKFFPRVMKEAKEIRKWNPAVGEVSEIEA